MDDRDAALKFAAVAEEYSAGDLAQAAKRTKAAAKGWKDGSRAPSLASIINMARSLPSIAAWLAEETDHGRNAQDSTLTLLKRKALEESDEGKFARSMLRSAGVID